VNRKENLPGKKLAESEAKKSPEKEAPNFTGKSAKKAENASQSSVVQSSIGLSAGKVAKAEVRRIVEVTIELTITLRS
jgi:hypothetical protein